MSDKTDYRMVNKQLSAEIDYKALGHHMRDARRHCKLTQAEIAEKMKLGVKYYAALEAGTANINLLRLIQFITITHDIPMQRRECLDFIAKQDDWSFFDERLEKGVSGFKVSAAKRDVIIEIREMAERKMFDVLLVFMFDRLGRREDETPFLVQWFVEKGIEVYLSQFC